MTRKNFRLEPHPSDGSVENMEITGWIERRIHGVAFSLQLAGPPGEILIPAPSNRPARRHGLWEKTCFELFLGLKNSPRYWEFNLSPAGHWNVYRFSGYRRDMQEEGLFALLPFTLREKGSSLSLSANLNLDRLVPRGQELKAGVSTVLSLKEGKRTYWALAHFGPKPDFHRREGFIIKL